MEDSGWLRLVAVGLILAALAVGYFLLSGRLISNSSVKTTPQASNVVASAGASATPSPSVLGQYTQATPYPIPKPTPTSAYNAIVNRQQRQVQSLPKTGSQAMLAGIFSLGIMISGLGLRKFPY